MCDIEPHPKQGADDERDAQENSKPFCGIGEERAPKDDRYSGADDAAVGEHRKPIVIEPYKKKSHAGETKPRQ